MYLIHYDTISYTHKDTIQLSLFFLYMGSYGLPKNMVCGKRSDSHAACQTKG